MTDQKVFTREEVEALIAYLQTGDNIVRLVDPLSEYLVNTDGTLQVGNICRTVWGRPHRCENCSSLRALQTKTTLYKMEFCDDRIYWIISRYLNVEGHDCILEIVADTTNSIIIEGEGADQISEVIESYNHNVITDSLTGVFNRNYLEEVFIPTIGFRRTNGFPINIAILDLDHFKNVNDGYGHTAGDQMLNDVGAYWRRRYNSRKKNHERLTIRYGGDEFIIIDCENSFEDFQKELAAAYEGMRKTSYLGGGNEVAFTLSYGAASAEEMPEDGWSWQDLFSIADTRMYEMKEDHHNSATG